jgi:hypothetical protein
MISRRIVLKTVVSSWPLGLFQVTPVSIAATGGKPLIWDVHFHLSGGSGETPEERMTQLIKYADRLGVQRFILSLGVPFVEDPSPEQLREANGQVLKALRPGLIARLALSI